MHKAHGIAAFASLALLSLSSSSFAQEAPPASTGQIPVPAWTGTAGAEDVVVLKDGGAIRGLVMEVLPGDHVSVRLADGRTAIVPWVLVHHIEQASHPAAPAVPATPAAPVTPQPAAPAVITGSATVHIVGDEVTLQMQRGGAWETACTSPCDHELPLDVNYRVTGSGVRTSGAFRLLAKPGEHVTLNVNTGSSTAFDGGVAMALLGGITATVGFWGWYVVLINNSEYEYDYNDGYYTSQSHHISPVPWAITMGVGAAVGTVGLILAVANEKTKVAQQAGAPDPKKDASLAPLPDRSPMWANLKPAGFPNAPQTTPIFSLKF